MKDSLSYRPKGLGPTLETEEWQRQKEKRDRMNEYSNVLRANHALKLPRIPEHHENEEKVEYSYPSKKPRQENESGLDGEFLKLLASLGKNH